MFKISGLDKLQRELDEAAKALDSLDGELGTVSFDPSSPSSIEAAIQSASALIDERISQFSENPMVAALVGSMKEQYREAILAKAAAARLEAEGESE